MTVPSGEGRDVSPLNRVPFSCLNLISIWSRAVMFPNLIIIIITSRRISSGEMGWELGHHLLVQTLPSEVTDQRVPLTHRHTGRVLTLTWWTLTKACSNRCRGKSRRCLGPTQIWRALEFLCESRLLFFQVMLCVGDSGLSQLLNNPLIAIT